MIIILLNFSKLYILLRDLRERLLNIHFLNDDNVFIFRLTSF